MNGSFVINYGSFGTFCISCYLLPKYFGAKIEIFNQTSELEMIQNDIKALILFSSIYPRVQMLLETLNGNIALGGAQINDKLITTLYQVNYSDNTANYYFKNGPSPYNPMFNPQKMSLISFQFSGPKCEAYSITIDPENDMKQIEKQLREFRSNLKIDAKSYSKIETVAFLFFNYKRHQEYCSYFDNINAGIEIFYSIFPDTLIIGTLTHAQYQ